MTWQQIIEQLTVFLIGTGMITFVIRTFIIQYFQKGVEQYKFELEKNLSRDKIRFARLHEERATVIKQTYQKIRIMEGALFSLVAPLQESEGLSREEKAQKFYQEFIELNNYFEKNKIFYEAKIASKIENLLNTCRKIVSEFRLAADLKSENQLKPYSEALMRMYDIFQKDIRTATQDLEKDFRQIIGINPA